MALNSQELAQLIAANIGTQDPKVIASYLSLAEAIVTHLLSKGVITVNVTIPAGVAVQVTPATGTGATIAPGVGTGTGTIS